MSCELFPRGETHCAAADYELEQVWVVYHRLEVILGYVVAISNHENLYSKYEIYNKVEEEGKG